MRKGIVSVLLFATPLLVGFSSFLSISGLQGYHTVSFYGAVRYREVLVQWSMSHEWGITDTAYAIDVSKRIGATTILLMTGLEYDTIEEEIVRELVDTYIAAGFKVWINPYELERVHTVADIQRFLDIPEVEGIAVDLESKNRAYRFDPATTEPALIELKNACSAAGKKFAYWHGMYHEYIDAKKLSDAGLIVWAWLSKWGENWYWDPGRWDLSPLWVQTSVYNRDGRYTTYSDILEWWNRLLSLKPEKPEAIVFWLTTCQHKPTEEQINGMKDITEAYMS